MHTVIGYVKFCRLEYLTYSRFSLHRKSLFAQLDLVIITKWKSVLIFRIWWLISNENLVSLSKYSKPTAEELETAFPTRIPLFGAWALNAIGHRIYCKCPPLKPYSSYTTVWDSLQTAQNTCTHIHFLIRFSCKKIC